MIIDDFEAIAERLKVIKQQEQPAESPVKQTPPPPPAEQECYDEYLCSGDYFGD